MVSSINMFSTSLSLPGHKTVLIKKRQLSHANGKNKVLKGVTRNAFGALRARFSQDTQEASAKEKEKPAAEEESDSDSAERNLTGALFVEKMQRLYLREDIKNGQVVNSENSEISNMHRLSNIFQKFKNLTKQIFKMNGRVKGFILLNLMTLIMSTNFVIIKEVQETLDPYTFSALRFTVAASALLPFLGEALKDKKLLAAAAEVGMYGGLGYLTQGVGLMTTDASRCSFLSALTVVLIPIIVGLSGRGVSKVTWASVAVAVLGIGLLEGIGSGSSNGGAPFSSFGDIFNLLSAAFFALQIFRTEHFTHTIINDRKLPFLATAISTTALSAIGLAAFTHIHEISNFLHLLPSMASSLPNLLKPFIHLPITQIIYTGIFSTDGILLIELVALKDVQSTDAAIMYTMEPVLGALWAYLFLGERWGINGWIGAGLILTSSIATQLYSANEKGKDHALKSD